MKQQAELREPYYPAGSAARGGSSGPITAQGWDPSSRETYGAFLVEVVLGVPGSVHEVTAAGP